MHADDARVPKVEDVTCVRQLVLVGDRDDVEALIAHILAEIDAGPEFDWVSWVSNLVGLLTSIGLVGQLSGPLCVCWR